jgi:hypothetical protein
MLSVTNKLFMLSVVMLNGVAVCVVMLNVLAPANLTLQPDFWHYK